MTPPSGGRALIRVKNRESECSPVAARVGAVVETRAEQDERDYRAQFEVNFFGAVALLRLVLPGMRARKRGTIVNVSSMDGIASVPVNGYYSSTKFALEGLTESLWQEIEPLGLRAMLVEPGTFRTGIEQRTKFSGKTIEDYSATSGAFRALVEKVTPDMFPITPALGEPSSRRRPSHALQRDLHEHRLPRAFAEHPLPPKWPRAFARPRSVAAGARGAMVVTPAARGPRVTVRAGPTNRSAAPGIGRCVSRVCKRGDDLYVEDGRDDDRVGALEQRSETRRRARVVRVAGSQRRDGNRRVEHVGAQRRPALSSATASTAVASAAPQGPAPPPVPTDPPHKGIKQQHQTRWRRGRYWAVQILPTRPISQQKRLLGNRLHNLSTRPDDGGGQRGEAARRRRHAFSPPRR
jgi:hypothetical protein